MNIVIISPFNIFPPFWGGAVRIIGIVNGLLADERNVVHLIYPSRKQLDIQPQKNLRTYFNGLNLRERLNLYQIPTSNKFGQAFNLRTIITAMMILRNNHDCIIWAEFTWSGIHGIMLKLFTRNALILDEHNIEYVRFKRFGSWIYPIVRILESISWSLADRIIVVSSSDSKYIPHSFRKKTIVLPNGYDASEFAPNKTSRATVRKRHNLSEDRSVVLFFGKLNYFPNYEALKIIANHLVPKITTIPSEIIVVGSGTPDKLEKVEGMKFLGTVDSISEYINASDVVIAPLRRGGGTKLKIIESIACGVPVVTTEIGAEGLSPEDFTGLLLVCKNNDWKSFVEIVKGVLKTPPSQREILHALRRLREYSWDAISKKIEHLIRYLS